MGADRTPVAVRVEGSGAVTVRLEGGEAQQAQEGLPLYEDDLIETSAAARASLAFFDHSVVRMDGQTVLQVEESVASDDDRRFAVNVQSGRVWIATPATSASGAVSRVVRTSLLTLDVPTGTEAVVATGAVYVFQADGLGVSVRLTDRDTPIYVGEGQKFLLTDAIPANDLYTYRSPLDARGDRTAFVEESRVAHPNKQSTSPPDAVGAGALLSVSSPSDGQTVDASIVQVSGRVSQRVNKVRINGYTVNIADDDTFTQDIVFETTRSSLEVHTEALDARDIILAEDVRTVKRTVSPVQQASAPVITSPGKTGEIYRTSEEDLRIRGTVPEGTVSVMVNDYKLLLFREGQTSWEYLAKTTLGNLRKGENTYDVVAIDADGRSSPPSRLTIIVGDDETVRSSSSSASSIIDETQLPKNAPLMPGSLSITAPLAGTQYAATESGFLIVGTTAAQTENIWVNGYRLQLYKPGKTTWSYIASEELRNLKTGTNTYVVNARNKEGKILDTLTYTVTH